MLESGEWRVGIPLMKLCPHYTGGYHVLNTMVLPFVPKKMRENEIKTTKQLLIIIYFIIEFYSSSRHTPPLLYNTW